MENKILDLTGMTDEAFNVAQKCINDWKADGAPLGLTYQSAEEARQFNESIQKGMMQNFEQGMLATAVSTIAAVGLGKLICFVVDKVKEKQS